MRFSLRHFAILAFLVCAGQPVLVFVLWPMSSITDQKREEVNERHLLIANTLSDTLGLYHRDIIAALESFAADIAANRAIEARQIFSNLNFRHVCVADVATGEVLAEYLADASPCPVALPEARLNMFQELAAEGTVGLSGVMAAQDGDPRLFVVRKVDDVFVIGAVGTDFFKELQSRISFGVNGHAVIVDQFGRVLAHPVAAWEETAHDLMSLEIVRATMRGESGVGTFRSLTTGEEMIAGYDAVDGVGWGVLVPQPMAEFEMFAERFNREGTIVLLLGLLLSLAMALWIANQFDRRLKLVKRALYDIADGPEGVVFNPKAPRVEITELRDLEAGVSTLAYDLSASNDRLKQEARVRLKTENDLRGSSLRFRSLFEAVPIPIREEDLSDLKAKVDTVGAADFKAFSAHLDANPEFIFECGHTIHIVDVNAAALRMHGYASKEEMMATVLRNFGPESKVYLRRTIEAVFRGDTAMAHEAAIYTSTGDRRELISNWVVVPGFERDYSRILMTSVDMTERLSSERALRQAQKMEAVGQLTGGIAHDFNNLLTVVGGNAELLTLDKGHDSNLVAPILRAVQRGAEMTQRLLAFSRNQPLKPQAVSILELAEGLLNLLRRTVDPQIGIEIIGQNDLKRALADPGQVEAAILNMVLNARDAMPKGGALTIDCCNVGAERLASLGLDAGDYVSLVVRDNGTGMPPETLQRVFEPFFTTKEVGQGSGLGLSMVYGFAHQSGGAVHIESQLGRGTAVELILPCATDSNIPATIDEAAADMPDGQGQTILVLEDDAEVLAFLSRQIARLGYQVMTAHDAGAAHEHVAAGRVFDLLISDIVLPGQQNGAEFADELRKQRPDLPVIFVSGYPRDVGTASDHVLPDAIWLNKPFSGKALADAIAQLLPRSRVRT